MQLKHLILALAFTVGVAFADDKKATLSYYYIDGWMMCNKIKVIVDDLKKEHSNSNITFVSKKIGTPEANQVLKEAGLELHGIVAKNANGEIVKAIEGHSYGKSKVSKVVKLLSEN